jgi:hypothetical protein
VTGSTERILLDTDIGCDIDDALCRAAGKDVPIHAGSPLPLLVEQRQPRAPQADPARFIDAFFGAFDPAGSAP